jgi:DNA-binding beta-propeller fold protein YncE
MYMRFSARISFTKLSGLVLGFLAVLGVMMPPVEAQTAPYVLPYTMSTYAGSHAIYTVGAACGTNTALDIAGAGCIASLFSVGADPHDVRVDPLGNVYFISNISQAVLYKINAKTGIVTVAAGSYTKHLPCTSSRDAYGDGCPATDGAANYQASGSAAYYTSDIP